MKDLSERIGNLSREKRALLEQRVKAKNSVVNHQPAITRKEGSGPRPQSFAQQRLWLLDQMEPENSAYSIVGAFRLTGELDVAVLERAFGEIIRRHEALRTTFHKGEHGQPVQVIGSVPASKLRVVDLRGVTERQWEAEARHLVRPFDLAVGPLFRTTLVRMTDTEHIVVVAMHHIVSDGWSLGVLSEELSELYVAYSQGHPSPLPELPIQYADFAAWQRDWLQGEVLESQLVYWRKQLGNLPSVLELPMDRPRPVVQTYEGDIRAFELSKDLTERLKALGREEGATLFTTLLAGFKTLLHRYTGHVDLSVGSPIANRNRTEIEKLIGFFVNTLVLRTDLSGNPSFRELLERVRKVTIAAYDHQDIPFEKLVDELRPERDPSHSPLFQVMFVLQNAPMSPLRLPGLTLSPVPVAGKTAKFDLTLYLAESPLGLSGIFEYNTGLFEASTITRMMGHFQTLLEGIAADPDQRLSDLPMLTEAEPHQLLIEWNDTQTDYPQDRCIHELFEAQVERTPDAIAVVIEDEQLTYGELNRRANQLAHHLRKLRVEPEVMAGICMERSLAMVVGLLGILKAGGAYVPLDPAYPKERLAFMLEDTQAPVVLTQQHLVERLPDHGAQGGPEQSRRIVCLDSDWEAIAQESQENPISRVTGDNLAYVMYTSGSTGTPKGVAVPHRGVLRLLLGANYVHLDAKETFLHMAPISFDASTFELWGAFLHGARCVLFPDQIPTAKDLGYIIQRHGVSTLWLTASLFNAVIDESPEVLSTIRQLVIGGEALSVAHVRRALELLPSTQIINGYGPTEGTTFTCCYPIPRELSDATRSVPIGKPISNTQVYVLDADLNPVPIGVPGELCIGGDGLARGYLNQPELTAEKFIPNPFSEEAGARLYKTGDLVRYLPDGNIEFLGRMDDQVKLRGFRVELGEIEAVLGQHPGVQESVILAREDTPGDKRLVAYVVPNGEVASPPSELRGFLLQKLPDYMIPSAFVMLDALPLTPNGKVDRQALPEPSHERPEGEKGFVAPQDTLELQLTTMFAKVLGVQPVGVQDDFFELGGNSLSAMVLFTEIEETLGKKLPLAILFQTPTVEQLASKLRQEGWSVPWSSLVAIQPHGTKLPFFCVHGGGGHVLGFAELAQLLGEDQPFYGLEAPGRDGEQDPLTRIEDLAAHYIEEIRGVQPEGPYFLGGHCLGGLVGFEMAQQLRCQGQQISLLALLNTGNPALFANRTQRSTQRLIHWTRRFAHHGKYLVRRPPWEYPRYILEKVQVAKIFMTRHSRIWKVNHRAAYSYRPKPYEGQIVLFLPHEEPQSPYPQLGWGDVVAGGVKTYEVPGDLRTMLLNPHVNVLGNHLKRLLDAAQTAEIGEEAGVFGC